MAELHLQLLGDFCLTHAGKIVGTIDTPRLRALITYLALQRHAPQKRHYLAFRFWPDSSEAQALTNLRKQLLYLRNAWPDAERFIDISRQTIRWRAIDEFRFDVAQFEAALSQAEATTDEQTIHLLRREISLYRGDLLPECYDDWIFPIRETLRAQYRRGLERLVQLLEEHRDYTTAILYAQQLLRHDPLHEPTYRQIMRLYALNGDRAMALRIYHTCVTQLREELGVDPGAETQAAYEQLLNHQSPAEINQVTGHAVPFVGRQAEWQVLQQSWQKSMRGQTHFVLIAGEAGIGKTRLAEALLDWARHQGIGTARTRSYAAEGRLAYAPIVEWLRTDLLFPHLQRLATVWLTELGRLLPEIFTTYPHVPHPDALAQIWQRGQLFEALSRAIHVPSRPLVLLIDDLQWCDQETLEWLHFLMRFAPNTNRQQDGQAQLLIIGTARTEEINIDHPLTALLTDLRNDNQLTEIDLTPLSVAETAELAGSIALEVLEESTIVQLYRSTEGNPLFVVETMRIDHWQSALDGANDRLILATDYVLSPKIQAVIQSRLAQLSPQARQVATLAAIIGREFTFDVLSAASQQDTYLLVDALDELWQRRIIREQGFHAYDFSHDRIREVAAATVSRARRQLMHQCVAEALEKLYANTLDIMAASIAAHCEQAGLVKKAIVYYQQAAATALHIYANLEAIAHFRRALSLLEKLPASSERDKLELELLLALGAALIAVYAYAPKHVLPVYERAHELAQQLGYPFKPVIWRTLCITYLGYQDFEQVAVWGRQILKIAHHQPAQIDPVLFVEGNYVLGVTEFWRGHFIQAEAYLKAAIEAYNVEQRNIHIDIYGQDPGIYCRARLGWTLWYLGYPDQASQMCESSVALAQKLGHPFSLQLALAFSTWSSVDCREINAAIAHFELIKNSYQEGQRQSNFSAVTWMLQGWCYTQCGQIEIGISSFRTCIEMHKQANTGALYIPHTLGLVAEAYKTAGDYAQGLTAVEEALSRLGDKLGYWYTAELLRIKGDLLFAQQGQSTLEIEQCFVQALEIARLQQAKSLELRATMSLAKLWMQQDKQVQARSLLADVYNWFTEGFDTTDLQAAKALLDQLA